MNAAVQGRMLLRVVMYWVCCIISITALIVTWRICVSGPDQTFWTHVDELWFLYKPVATASMILVPLLMIDVVRFSHRFVGPMKRLKNALEELGRGEDVPPIKFRNKDLCKDYAEAFNAVLERMKKLEHAVSQANEEVQENELPFGDDSTDESETPREREAELAAV